MRIRDHVLVRCAACRSLYAPRLPTDEELATMYASEEYYAWDRPGPAHGYKDYLSNREEIEVRFDRIVGHIESFQPPGRLVDVGSGPGFLLTAARARGWSVEGVEPNPWAVEYARNELGLTMHQGYLNDAQLEAGGYDAVTQMDVIEHVRDPDDVVAQSVRLLRPGGVIAVMTTFTDSVVSRLLGKRLPDAERPEHLALLSRRALATVLLRHGVRPLGWHSVGKSAPLRLLVKDGAPISPKVAELLGRALQGKLGDRVITVDPLVKLCMYGRREPGTTSSQGLAPHPPRLRRKRTTR